MTTVVIPYRPGPDDGLELRYTLRGIDRYFDFDLEVALMGDKPKWATNLVHIPVTCRHDIECKENRATQKKLFTAAISDDVHENIIYMNDDMIFVQPVSQEEVIMPRANGSLKSVKNFKLYNRNASGLWKRLMKKTYQQLLAEKLPLYSYESHTPRAMTKTDVRVMVRKYHMLDQAWHMMTLIMNNLHDKPAMELLPVKGGDFKLTIGKEWDIDTFHAKAKLRKMMSIYTAAYNARLKKFLLEYMPEPSRFEK